MATNGAVPGDTRSLGKLVSDLSEQASRLVRAEVELAKEELTAKAKHAGIGSGMFGAPNRTAIMNSVPATERGSASGVASTVQNAGSSLSIGVFFSLMIVGLAGSLPTALRSGLLAHGVPASAAEQVAQLPPVGSLFAAFLGYNPIQSLLGPTGILQAPHVDGAILTGKEFFPQLISGPFHDGLVVVFIAAAVMSIIGAVASFLGGGKYVHEEAVASERPAQAEGEEVGAGRT